MRILWKSMMRCWCEYRLTMPEEQKLKTSTKVMSSFQLYKFLLGCSASAQLQGLCIQQASTSMKVMSSFPLYKFLVGHSSTQFIFVVNDCLREFSSPHWSHMVVVILPCNTPIKYLAQISSFRVGLVCSRFLCHVCLTLFQNIVTKSLTQCEVNFKIFR